MNRPRRVERRLERVYRVRFDEAGPDGYLRSSGFLRFAQDLAWIHSETAGFGRDWYRDRGMFWLVRGIELTLLENVAYGTELSVTTELIGLRRVIARRLSQFRAAGSERPVAEVITDWVLLNESGRPVRPPSEILDAFGELPIGISPLHVLEREPATTDSIRTSFGVRRSETDPMAHVNNAVYFDYLDEQHLRVFDAPARASLPVPRRYRAEFVGSAAPGARLTAHSWPDDAAWCCRLTDDEGREMLRATVEVDPASWVGG